MSNKTQKTEVVTHNKIKNTGLLFEFITSQITADILSGKEQSIAQTILKEHFSSGSQLKKELEMYKLLMENHTSFDSRANTILHTALESYKKTNFTKLNKEKYELIKSLKENYDVDGLFNRKVANYKVYASIYKLFKMLEEQKYAEDPKETIRCKNTILEHLTGKRNKAEKQKPTINEAPEEIRTLALNILLKKFNNKYSDLLPEQKEILREYIYTGHNVPKLTAFIEGKKKELCTALTEMQNKVNDKVMRIKMTEVVKGVENVKRGKDVKDKDLAVLMMGYDLLNEIRKITANGK